MVSVDSLLDAHEVAVRSRVEALREQAAELAVQLAEAELALEHVAITRTTLVAVLAGHGEAAGQTPGGDEAGCGVRDSRLVPVWRADLAEEHLPAAYRRVWRVVVGQPAGVRVKQLAVMLGLETSAAKVEGLRCKLKRLVERGWLAEPAPGAFAPASTGSVSPCAGP